jgi:RNA polymerase sigma-70 factor (ECF subfamily)
MVASTEKLTAAEQLRRVLLEQGASLRRMASAWTRDAAERDDLLQDIALALLVALPTFRNECPQRAFVWRIAHNRCLLVARQRRRPAGQAHVALTDEHASPQRSPEAQLEQGQRARLLQTALRSLSEDHRAVLVLSFEGLSHDDIGEVVGASANAVGVRLHRARAALTTAMHALDPSARSSA